MSRKSFSSPEVASALMGQDNMPDDKQPKKKRVRKPNPLPYAVVTVDIGEGIKLCGVTLDKEIISTHMSVDGSPYKLMISQEGKPNMFGKVFTMRKGPGKIVARFANADDVTLPKVRYKTDASYVESAE